MTAAAETPPTPYGSWPSPITAELIASSSISLGSVGTDDRGNVFWLEGRPSEGGRVVIVRRAPDGTVADVIPAPFSARTRANEYGGTAYLSHDGATYFNNDADGRIYVVRDGGSPTALTPAAMTPEGAPMYQYADFAMDHRRNRLVCVREDSSVDSGNPTNTLVGVAVDGPEAVEVLVSDQGFFSNPRVAPDGTRMSWISWNPPDMPWDRSQLWVSELDRAGLLAEPVAHAGGEHVSMFQPEWSQDGRLYWVDDRTGWWNLYAMAEDGSDEAIIAIDKEIGYPQWAFGMEVYALHPSGDIACAVCDRGEWSLVHRRRDGSLDPLRLPFTEFKPSIRFAGDTVVAILASPSTPYSVVAVNPADSRFTVLQSGSDVPVGEEWFSTPERIEFVTGDGVTADGVTADGVTAHAFYYPPHNPKAQGPEGSLPPLIIMSHGGPTAAATTNLNLEIQYWTSRGIGVVVPNYGGSTGFGRDYRERLNLLWGVVDVNDCINAARFLVARGDVDPDRVCIEGASAGGYTALAALTSYAVFAAGVSYYGVADLGALVKDTHKFEARYLDRLVAPLLGGEAVYKERSPISHADRLSCPVLLLQGLEDRIVPPTQAKTMLDAMRARGVPCAYVPFEGEQHGWRRAETIIAALEATLSFYGQVLSFDPADNIPRLIIENLGAVPRGGVRGAARWASPRAYSHVATPSAQGHRPPAAESRPGPAQPAPKAIGNAGLD